MELTDYLKILRRRWWIIVVTVAITAASAWGFSKLQTPVYEAAVNVSINPARADYGLAQVAKMLLRNYVAVIHSEKWAGELIDALALDMTPGQLKGNVTVASDDSRLLIQIVVRDYAPDQAVRIADAWANKVETWRAEENQQQRKEDMVHAAKVDNAIGYLFSPKTKINIMAGAILGVVLAGVIIFFLEWVESGVVRSIDDVERYLDLTVLGAVPASE